MSPDKPRVFKSPEGQYYTQALFLETSYDDTSLVLYTLKNEDYTYNGVTYPSFPRLYLEIADPTEYKVSQLLFGGWPHWQRVTGSGKLSSVIEALREELEVKLRSQGVQRMISAAGKSEKAAAWLADRGWIQSTKGRPTKEAIQREARKISKVKDVIALDAERMKDFK